MLRVILVDDRKEIVQGIIGASDWEAREVEIRGFYNGADALAYLITNPADLLITDIRMPLMTGLELIAALRDHQIDIRAVLLTGYEDFSYAQEAIHLGAVEYLTKPVRIEALEALIEREHELARSNRAQQEESCEDWRRYQNSLPALRRQWAENVDSAAERPAQAEPMKLPETFRELGLSIRPEQLLIVRLGLELAEEASDADSMAVYRFAVRNMAAELIGESYPCEVLELGEDSVLILLNYPEKERPLSVTYHVGEILEKLDDSCGENVQLKGGIGSCSADEGGFLRSWEDARRAMDQNFFLAEPRILSVLELPDEKEEAYPRALQEEIELHLRRRELAQARPLLMELFDVLSKMTGTRPERLREELLTFLVHLFHECAMEQYLNAASAIAQFQEKHTLRELREWFLGLTEYLEDQIDENASQTTRGVYEVRHYIDSHYAEAISLKSMAAMIYVSPAYLSFSFKEILGVNFNEYLTSVRIEAAKKLLEEKQYRVYEVCEMVGYRDKKYFSDLFRKATGVFPKDWI